MVLKSVHRADERVISENVWRVVENGIRRDGWWQLIGGPPDVIRVNPPGGPGHGQDRGLFPI